MTGSMRSAVLYVISAILMIAQGVLSMAGLDDWLGAFVAGAFAFIMFVGAAFAKTGGMTAIQEHTYTEQTGWGEIRHYRDTGQRLQCTPCFGLGGGIGAVVAAFLLAEPLFVDMGVGGAIFIAPAILGGIIAIVAAILFTIDYRGEWSTTV